MSIFDNYSPVGWMRFRLATLILNILVVLLQLFLFSALPYIIYLLSSWDPVYFDLDPHYVMISSAPFIAQLKINLTLTISIAMERILALYFPVAFRMLSSRSYAMFCVLFGFFLAIWDLVLEFSLSPSNHSPNCLSVGCFLCEQFRWYWGISNMVRFFFLNTVYKFCTCSKKFKQVVHDFFQYGRSFAAYRTGFLLISLVFVTIPSVGAGMVEMIGFSVFKAIGSFYIFGLLCAGCNYTIKISVLILYFRHTYQCSTPYFKRESASSGENIYRWKTPITCRYSIRC
ncbi:unnamed protein product [Angiostrongylus costaricensis]|uniref:G protein-coupled receptor n=1 Tax=Angiostrongylus costaricensis TaxID=334426 RepID=A0A0R3Q0W6_ANGCS|nr:unnamed protein product [Angiostrongylus costaricensis]